MELFNETFLDALADKVAERVLSKLEGLRPDGVKRTIPAKLLSGCEVCQILGISSSTLNRRVKEGDIVPVFIGRKVMFNQEDVNSYINQYK